MTDSADHLLDEVNKRFTLNLLIQGSAQHAFLTSHYLVRDELMAIDPNLLRLYDQLAAAFFILSWRGESVLFNGWPDRFWRRAAHRKHPFCRHPFLLRHGRSLAQGAKKRACERIRAKRVTRIPILFSMQLIIRMIQAGLREDDHQAALVDLAKRATHQVWGIPYDRMDGALTSSVVFGQQRPPTGLRAWFLRKAAAGYGGVLNEESELRVVARACVWPLLSHELVKGTVELICMHGLNQLDATTYRMVLQATDRIEYEPWMIPTGAELWRQLLPLLPDDRHVSEMVMHLARLPSRSLEELMFAVVEDTDAAREWLAVLGRDQDEQNGVPWES